MMRRGDRRRNRQLFRPGLLRLGGSYGEEIQGVMLRMRSLCLLRSRRLVIRGGLYRRGNGRMGYRSEGS